MIQRLLIWIYGLVFALLFGVVFSAQILGFLRLYAPLPVLLGTVAATLAAAYFYFRSGRTWWRGFAPQPRPTPGEAMAAVCALLLLLLIFGLRMALWPESALGAIHHEDMIVYHLPKAIELARTGGMWSLGIPYGQYPIGYESLTSLAILLTGSYARLGLAHALITVFLILTIVLLLRRYTPLPTGWLLLGGVLLWLYPTLYSQILIVGKNDLLLSATLLAAVLHAPIDDRGAPVRWHPWGLAAASLLTLAIKGNGVFVLGGLWLWVLLHWYRAYRAGRAADFLRVPQFVALLGVMAVGGLWVIRNLIVMGRPYSPEVAGFFSTTFAANLFNPQVYTMGTESTALVLLLAIMAASVAMAARYSWGAAWALALMWFAILMTPLGLFRGPLETQIDIEWRYTTYAFLYIVVLVPALIAPLLARLLAALEQNRLVRWLLPVGVVVVTAGILWALDVRTFLERDEDHWQRLRAPADVAPGVDGYAHVYDFVQREIANAVVYYEEFTPLFVYDPGFTNQPINTIYPLGQPEAIEEPPPDVLVYPDFNNITGDALLPEPPSTWRLIYDDGVGRVYQRVEPSG